MGDFQDMQRDLAETRRLERRRAAIAAAVLIVILFVGAFALWRASLWLTLP